MKISDSPEYSTSRSIDYIPIVSSFYNIGKELINFVKMLIGKSPQAAPGEMPKSLKGRVEFWGAHERSFIASIPVVGNFIVYRHDHNVHANLIKVLENASEEQTAEIMQQIPAYLRNSPEFYFRDPSSIFDNLLYRNYKILAHAPKELLSNKKFMIGALYCTDRGDVLKYSPELAADKDFLIEAVNFCGDSRVLLGMADELKSDKYFFERVLNSCPGQCNWILNAFKPLTHEPGIVAFSTRFPNIEITACLDKPAWGNHGKAVLLMMEYLEKQVFTSGGHGSGEGHSWGISISQIRPGNSLGLLPHIDPVLLNDADFITSAMKINAKALDHATPAVKEKLRAK